MKATFDKSVADLSRVIDRFPWTERAAYAEWLAQTFYYVRHSTRLLAAAAARFSFDAAGSSLHHRFAAHMAEEKKHELLAIHDLKQLDLSIDSFPERDSTRMFYEPQYYKIEHQDPIVLFGYILPLEALGPTCGARIIDQVTGVFGQKCASFVRVHAEDDISHLEKAFASLDGISEVHRRLVEQNMRQSTYSYLQMLSDMTSRLVA